MQGRSPDPDQSTFLQADLRTLLDPNHELRRLAEQIPWGVFEEQFAKLYPRRGRPAHPIRLMVGLLMLKHLFNVSDEAVVEQWRRDPYFQFFCGEVVFRWELPCHPTDLVLFRKRLGTDGVEDILQVSVLMHGEAASAEAVILDTTAQEKNIQPPHDSKLYRRVAETIVRVAKREGIPLSRTYQKEIKDLQRKLRTRNYPRARRKAAKATRRLRTIAGRLFREFKRRATEAQLVASVDMLASAERILSQQRGDKGKCYSLHEPQCYAMNRGKDYKQWEFGTKVSVAVNRHGVIVGAMNLARNAYDGHTVDDALEQVERITGSSVQTVVGDLGYRNATVSGDTTVYTPADMTKKRNDWLTRRLARKLCRWRPCVEPIIGHMKHDHRLGRNYLKGWFGDEINVMLAAAGFNFRKLLRKLWLCMSAIVARLVQAENSTGERHIVLKWAA